MITRLLQRWLYSPLVEENERLKAELWKYKLALGDAYLTLDRIAMRDDAPSIELSKMAYDVIEKHKITVKRMKPEENNNESNE